MAVIHLPTPPRTLDDFDMLDLGKALQQIGLDVLRNKLLDTGTLIVPYQERIDMKVKLEVTKAGERGPQGKFWEFEMQYHNLPEVYEGEVKGAASAFAAYIGNMKGGAGQLKAYKVEFQYDGGKGEADQLLYSQMVEVQKAGIKLMEKLLLGAEMEIASGQRS